MATRSRKGCIDCKQAKVKCDEVHPSCGTCTRRRRQCRGYAFGHAVRALPSRETRPAGHSQGMEPMERAAVEVTGQRQQLQPFWLQQQQQQQQQLLLQVQPSPDSWQDTSRGHETLADDALVLLPSPTRGPSWIPQDAIVAADKPFVEMYFARHPTEMVMSDASFIHEMNAIVLALLQHHPADVADSLSAIGENYCHHHGHHAADSGHALVATRRKTRLLSRMRVINEHGGQPELVLLVLLALCGAELTDPLSDGMGTSLHALIENVALILEFHARSGRALNDEARYFARGVARQDLLLSLARLQRPRIDPALWLDDGARHRADRLLGLTATLTPVLARLAGLAEDVQDLRDLQDGSPDWLPAPRPDLAERAAAIRAQLLVWRPVHDSSLSLRASRKFLLHAAAWRAAALLYLFRLFDRAGSAAAADDVAQGMAYEVLLHVAGQPADAKLSLWPLFVAACEMVRPEDRDAAAQLFDHICRVRPVLTARRTRAFCTEHIWPARDRGDLWDWMTLARGNAFLPL